MSLSKSNRYSLAVIRDEAQHLVQQGLLGRQQPIYALCKYIPSHEWIEMERELEEHDFLLRDRIADLIVSEDWDDED